MSDVPIGYSTGEQYVTKTEYEQNRREVEKRLEEGSVKFAELETTLKSVKSTLNVILGALVSGIGSILVILLTRGL